MAKGTAIALKVRERIRALRAEKGLTQEKLAALSGVYYKHIQALESKEPMSAGIDTLEKICNALGIELHEFFNDPVFTRPRKPTK